MCGFAQRAAFARRTFSQVERRLDRRGTDLGAMMSALYERDLHTRLPEDVRRDLMRKLISHLASRTTDAGRVAWRALEEALEEERLLSFRADGATIAVDSSGTSVSRAETAADEGSVPRTGSELKGRFRLIECR
jgi:hypothetical protein